MRKNYIWEKTAVPEKGIQDTTAKRIYSFSSSILNTFFREVAYFGKYKVAYSAAGVTIPESIFTIK